MPDKTTKQDRLRELRLIKHARLNRPPKASVSQLKAQMTRAAKKGKPRGRR